VFIKILVSYQDLIIIISQLKYLTLQNVVIVTGDTFPTVR